MKTTTKYLITFTAFLMIAISCNKDDDGGSSGNSDAKEITSFAFTASDNETLEADVQGTINEDANTIVATAPYGTNITALSPVVEVSQGASYAPEGAQDFTEPVTYTVNAQDGTSAEYTVTVVVAENDDVQILSFQFLANANNALTQNVNAVINTGDHTITATVPFETNITALIPAITTSAGATYTPEGIQDFSSPVMYTVTAAAEETTQTYTVTVTVEPGEDALALQWQALMDIYEASYDNGYQIHYLNWDISNPDISAWEGITTDADGYVTELNLYSKLIFGGLVPESIGNLTRLQVLNLGDNDLDVIPLSIGNLSQLRELDLGDNELTGLPISFGNLNTLERLYLRGNIFTEVPQSLMLIAGNLIFLSMNDNDLSGGLPEWIGDFTALEELHMGTCKLTELPSSFGNLNALQIIDLWNNDLSGAFPEWIGGLSELQYLYIRNNSLDALPDELMDLENLTYIDIKGNNFGMLSGDMCEYLVGINTHMDAGTCP